MQNKIFGLDWPIIAAVLLGTIISALVAQGVQLSYEQKVVSDFRVAAENRFRSIGDKVEETEHLLNSLVAFFYASKEVNENEFTTIVQQMIRDKRNVLAAGWLPHVSRSGRGAFEAEISREYPGTTIRKLAEDGSFETADIHQDYFPARYISPLYLNDHAIGFDMLSDPERSIAMRRAWETGRVSSTGRVRLALYRPSLEYGFLSVAPVYQDFTPGTLAINREIRGFAAIAVPLDELITSAVGPLVPAGINIIIRDSRVEPENSLMYVYVDHFSTMSTEQVLAAENERHSVYYHDFIEVGGHQWDIKFLPADGFFPTGYTLESKLALVAGVILTFFIGLYLTTLLGRQRRIQKEVSARTYDLGRAKARFELLLRSSREGIIGLDESGRVSFVNPYALQLLGYSSEEVIGHHHTLFCHSRPDGSHCPAQESQIEKVLRDSKARIVQDAVFWCRNGEALPVEFTCAPLHEGDKVAGSVITFRGISERKKYIESLQNLAQYDQLTGVANRTLFMDILKKAMLLADRNAGAIAVIYLDINDFKTINDTLGHATGDAVLCAFARRVGSALRGHDMMARLGGDEFCILIHDVASRSDCHTVLNRIAEAMKAPLVVNGTQLVVTSSIGAAIYPDKAASVDDLISLADGAMYIAKRNKSLPYVLDGEPFFESTVG